VQSREDGHHGGVHHEKETELSRKEREERERQRDRREERAISAERGDGPSDYDSEEEEDLAGSDISSLRTFQRSDFQVPFSPSKPLATDREQKEIRGQCRVC